MHDSVQQLPLIIYTGAAGFLVAPSERIMAASPTTLTLKRLRDRGMIADRHCVVERNHRAGGKRWKTDYIGCIDIIAIGENYTLGVQATSYSNVSSRVRKSMDEPRLIDWLSPEPKRSFAVWGWHKVTGSWTPRVVGVVLGSGGKLCALEVKK
jgi:hypothetical protein